MTTITPDMTMNLQYIPRKEIHANHNFNCRGTLVPLDVIDLVKDIQDEGRLIQPIVVRKYDEAKQKLFPGFKYGLVAGFRRHLACTVIGWDMIPAVVHETMTDEAARLLNIKENLKRKDLNVVQEAKAIEHFTYTGHTREWIARELGQSMGWVQIRMMVLDFPPDIQDAIAAGLVNQSQIREIYSLPPSRRHEAVKMVKQARERGESTTLLTKKMATKKDSKRIRGKKEIFLLMAEIQSIVGPCVLTRALGWCAGEVSDEEVYQEIDKFFHSVYGPNLSMPPLKDYSLDSQR